MNFGEELHRNIEEGSALKALSAIKKCINGDIVNSWDGTKEIPLTKAARTGQHAILQALIDHPFIEVDMLGRPKCALYQAVCNGDLQSVTILLGHPGYAPQDWTRVCVLALRWGHVSILQTLFAHGAVTDEIQNAVKFEAANNKWKISPDMLSFLERGMVCESPRDQTGGICIEKSYFICTVVEGSSWLAARLLCKGFDPRLVRDCECKMVTQEGFVSAALFATLPAAELTFAYLDKIGITAKGLQLELMQMHRALQSEGLPAEFYNISSIETPFNAELSAFKTSSRLMDDNRNDPVCVTEE